MIIENLTCTCGKTCRIETDDPAFVDKKKKEFEKKLADWINSDPDLDSKY